MSRVLGVARDVLIARFLGTGVVADAFFAAFRFPNMFRRIFGEGAFNSAFVPMFGKRVTQDGRNSAMVFANNAFTILFGTLGVLTLLAIPLMAAVMLVVVPGFLPKVEQELTPNLRSSGWAFGEQGGLYGREDGEAGWRTYPSSERESRRFGSVGEIFGQVQAEGKRVTLESVLDEGLKRKGR